MSLLYSRHPSPAPSATTLKPVDGRHSRRCLGPCPRNRPIRPPHENSQISYASWGQSDARSLFARRWFCPCAHKPHVAIANMGRTPATRLVGPRDLLTVRPEIQQRRMLCRGVRLVPRRAQSSVCNACAVSERPSQPTASARLVVRAQLVTGRPHDLHSVVDRFVFAG